MAATLFRSSFASSERHRIHCRLPDTECSRRSAGWSFHWLRYDTWCGCGRRKCPVVILAISERSLRRRACRRWVRELPRREVYPKGKGDRAQREGCNKWPRRGEPAIVDWEQQVSRQTVGYGRATLSLSRKAARKARAVGREQTSDTERKRDGRERR